MWHLPQRAKKICILCQPKIHSYGSRPQECEKSEIEARTCWIHHSEQESSEIQGDDSNKKKNTACREKLSNQRRFAAHARA